MHNAEYFPSENESDSSASEASRKAWDTARAQAVAATRKTPYDLREQCSYCNDAKLNPFAKLLFCRLTDMAFKEDFKRGEGVLACSKKFLADAFEVSAGTITRATRALEKSGFLWTKIRWNGSFEITWWFIRDWADDKNEYDRHSGENFGRKVQGVQRNTTRNGHGRFAANPHSMRSKFRVWLASSAQEPTVKAEMNPNHGQESTLTTVKDGSGQGLPLNPVHGQESTLTAPLIEPGKGSQLNPDQTVKSTLTTGGNEPGQTAEMSGLDTLKSVTAGSEGDSSKRSTGLNAQGAGRETRKASAENLFLLEVGITMDKWKKGHAKVELSGSGAWWRLAFRKDAKLARKVLEDTLAAVKESRILATPGAHAVDLWGRWGGKPVGEGAR
jgi:hypothetical protein